MRFTLAIMTTIKARVNRRTVTSLRSARPERIVLVYRFPGTPPLAAERTVTMSTEVPLYKDSTAPVSERVRDLLDRMTLEEKAGQTAVFRLGGMGAGGLLQAIPPEEVRSFMIRMGAGLGIPEGGIPEPPPEMHLGVFREDGSVDEAKVEALLNSNPGGGTSGAGASPRAQAETANVVQRIARDKTRLGIPVIFHGEGLHGYVNNGTTIFPQALALAGTWNTELIGRIGRAIGTEARAMGAHDLFAPVLDIARDPRWGRTEETYGEDPYLASRMGVAMIKGMQGRRLSDPDAVICGGKHFGGHGEPLGGRDSNMEGITERDLREVHFRTFAAAVQEAGANCIMAAYHALDGIPCHANHWLLTEVLREEWGFGGHVVSDAGGVEGIHDKHRVARDHREAVRMAIEAGVDTFLAFGGGFTGAIVDLVEKGELSEEQLDETVGWILKCKFDLGLFDQPYTDPDVAEAVCNSAEHRALALQAAEQSIVLLKNQGGLLPLTGKARRILVTGPNADAARNQLGDYSGTSTVTTVLERIRRRAVDAQVQYVRGCGVKDMDASGIAEAVEAAGNADVAILVLGESSWTDGMVCGEGNDRADLDLPGVQQQLLEAVSATGTPVVLVLINGRPLSLRWAKENVPAILEAWYPGQEGGTAIASVLWGDVNPSGKLPITVPQSVGQLPHYYNYKPTGRAYDYVTSDFDPLFAFGYGLSYTTFSYSDLVITPETIGPAAHVTVHVTVSNTGDRAGDEVVQLYVNDVISSVVTPVIELKAFQRISLAPGESKTVTFDLGPKDLELLDKHLEPVVEPGTFEVQVGGLKGSFEVLQPPYVRYERRPMRPQGE